MPTAADLVTAVVILAFAVAAWMRTLLELWVRAAVQHRWIVLWLESLPIISEGRWNAKVDPDTWLVGREFNRLESRGTADLLSLVEGSARSSESIYSLHYTQVCAQFGSAVQDSLGYPPKTTYDDKDPPDVPPRAISEDQYLLALLFGLSASTSDLSAWLRGQSVGSDAGLGGDEIQQRLATLIERRLDELQTYLAHAWMQFNHALAYALLGLLLFPLVAIAQGALVLVGVTAQNPVELPTVANTLRPVALILTPPAFGIVFLAFLPAAAALLLVARRGAMPWYGLVIAAVPIIWLVLAVLAFTSPLNLGFDTLAVSVVLVGGVTSGLLIPTAGRLLERLSGTRT